jgi:deoxyribodipyrimidine photolyase-related protein
MKKPVRHLVLVLGDQLDADSAAFDGFDTDQDAVWMAEVFEESTHVPASKVRIAMFLAAMRHFRDELTDRGITVHYHELTRSDTASTFASRLERTVRDVKPQKLIIVEPGEYRVRESIQQRAGKLKIELEIRTDRHFISTVDQFNDWADGRKQLRLEYFYREMRRQTGVLMDDDQPVGGQWNYDKDNRGTFGSDGPGLLRDPMAFSIDDTTQDVIDLVNDKFAEHPGTLDDFDWPVTRTQARRALTDFVKHRLPSFGQYQDAMWTDQPWLYHARLAAAFNLKLLNPREAIKAAEQAYHDGHAPLNAVEGFIRQLLGWREYVRGVYWRYMPDYIDRNTLGASADLPDFYWTGQTDMHCLRDTITQTLRYGYAHHIQRLMVTGLFVLLADVDPKQVHQWYLSVYVDAVEWVELPNTLGMSQFADDGVMASKPYIASGKYIDRMSNYCKHCRYDPAKATGDDACPFTTLYWDFLQRHRKTLASNNRMTMQLRNIDRKQDDQLRAIRKQARALRRSISCP